MNRHTAIAHANAKTDRNNFTTPLAPPMVRLYMRNLKWTCTKEQLRWMMWNLAQVNGWLARVSIYFMRPAWNDYNETHASCFVDGLSASEAAAVLRNCGGLQDHTVTARKRLHIEVANPRHLGRTNFFRINFTDAILRTAMINLY